MRATWLAIVLTLGAGAARLQAQGPVPGIPYAELLPTTTMLMPAEPDSNSPVVQRTGATGGTVFTIFSSTFQGPSRTVGTGLMPAGPPALVDFVVRPVYNHWFEAMVPAPNGTWYGFYHYEVPASTVCPNDHRHMPSIGAARSFDFGQTWEDLGVVLRAPIGSHLCSTINQFFVGGVGDFTAVLHPTDGYLYFYYSQYSNVVADQGVAVARMLWTDRDTPAGKMTVYRNGRWVPAFVPEGQLVPGVAPEWQYVSGTPIFPAQRSWHSSDGVVDAFWGPSVHWNTHLNGFVMLLNRASDTNWGQEGIYVAYERGGMRRWTVPQRLLTGGGWYPQVIGTEVGTGTDRLAGETARLFIRGTSTHLIRFTPLMPNPPVRDGSTPETSETLPTEVADPSPGLPAVLPVDVTAAGVVASPTTITGGQLSSPSWVSVIPLVAPSSLNAEPVTPAVADLKTGPIVEPVAPAVESVAAPPTPDLAPPAPQLPVVAPVLEAPAPAAMRPEVVVTAPVVRYPAIYAGLAPAPGGSRPTASADRKSDSTSGTAPVAEDVASPNAPSDNVAGDGSQAPQASSCQQVPGATADADAAVVSNSASDRSEPCAVPAQSSATTSEQAQPTPAQGR